MYLNYSKDKSEIEINTEKISGNFKLKPVDGRIENATYSLRELLYKPKSTIISPENCQKEHVGVLNFYKAYSENAWLKTFRADSYFVEIIENKVRFTWSPTISHQVNTKVEYIFSDEDYVDICLSTEAYGYYQGYEIILSNYITASFVNGVILKDNVNKKRKSLLPFSSVYQDTYLFFPRDENAIRIMADGRHYKGHWYWDCSYGKEYYLPLVTSRNQAVEVILMGLKKDIHSVGTTYSGIENYTDDVIDHYAQYLRIFGTDITPGTGKRTMIRCQFKPLIKSIEEYDELYKNFEQDYKDFESTMELSPMSS